MKESRELDINAARKINSAIANAYKAMRSNQFWADFAAGMNTSLAQQQYAKGNYYSAWQSHASAQKVRNQMAADLQAGTMTSQNYINHILERLNVLGISAPESIKAMVNMQGLSASLVKRTMRDVEQYIVELALEVQKISRKNELEADKLAVEYMANAGLNPESCVEVIEFIHRNTDDSSTRALATHPGEDERLNAIKKAIQDLSPRMKRKYKNAGPRFKYPLLPYVYDKETEVVRLSLSGTRGMTQGGNDRKSVVDSVFGN